MDAHDTEPNGNVRNEFSNFLKAVQELRGSEDAVRTTAHTSSVTSTDWKRIEAEQLKLGS